MKPLSRKASSCGLQASDRRVPDKSGMVSHTPYSAAIFLSAATSQEVAKALSRALTASIALQTLNFVSHRKDWKRIAAQLCLMSPR